MRSSSSSTRCPTSRSMPTLTSCAFPRLGQLVQHLDRRVRTFRVVVEEFRILRGEFVERDLQPFHPAADAFGEKLVLLDRIDQVLHYVQGVVQLFAERLLAAVLGLQHFHQPRLQTAVGDRRVAEFGLDLRDRLQDVFGIVALIRRCVRRRELDFFGRALHAARAAAEVQQFARGLVHLRRTAFPCSAQTGCTSVRGAVEIPSAAIAASRTGPSSS